MLFIMVRGCLGRRGEADRRLSEARSPSRRGPRLMQLDLGAFGDAGRGGTAVNDDGGTGIDASIPDGYCTITTTPEPSTLVLSGIAGLAFLGLRLRAPQDGLKVNSKLIGAAVALPPRCGKPAVAVKQLPPQCVYIRSVVAQSAQFFSWGRGPSA